MKNQQQAEKEEQQRIKNLVLNYEIRENEEQDGEVTPSQRPFLVGMPSTDDQQS
ncbi:hypothetical protein SODALDRAFT_333322, partial [Sodiomyces alkalinus F11]